jgi:hypothetical protein
MVYRVAPTGGFSKLAAKQLGVDLAMAFAAVMFANTSFLRVRFVELDEYNRSVPGSGVGRPLSLVGRNAFAEDDGPASAHVVLNIEKSSDGGDPAITVLRHCLSAKEFAAYQLETTIPARFGAAPAGAYGAGDSLSENMKKALADNNFVLKLPPVKINGVLTPRVITEIETQQFRNLTNTKNRISAAAKVAQGVQQLINEYARKAWRTFKRFTGVDMPAAAIKAIQDLIALALNAYFDLPVATRMFVNYPIFPAVPAG